MKNLFKALTLCLTLLSLTMPAFAADEDMSETVAMIEQQVVMVNINEADAEMLSDLLIGIGPSKAQAIIAYRLENGPFATIEELTNVRGIGMATVEKNAAIIEL